MTQHVRAGYRKHRKAWRLALLTIFAMTAVVLVPLGSAKPPTAPVKLYDICLEGGSTPCTDWSSTGGSTSTLSGSQVTLNIKNEVGSNTSLGSANLDMPAGITLQLPVGAPGNLVTGTSTPTQLQLRNLNLAPGASKDVTFTVATPSACGSVTWNPPPAKQSNDFNGSGNDYLLKQWSGLTSLITAGCHLEWIYEPASARQSQTITATAFNPTGPNVAVEVQDANDDPIDLDTGNATLAVSGTFDPCGSCPPPPTFTGLTSTTFQNGRATFPDLKSAYTGTGFTAQASALGLQTPASDPPFVVTQNGTDCANLDPCFLSTPLTNSQVDVKGSGGNFIFIAIRGVTIDPSATEGGCANFIGTKAGDFEESDGRNGDGTLDFTYYIKDKDLKAAYGTNYGQPNVPICAGAKYLVNNAPVACNDDNYPGQLGWADRLLGDDHKFHGEYDVAHCAPDGFWYGILGTKQDPNPPFDSNAVPLITSWGTTPDGVYRTFNIHVPKNIDIRFGG